MRATDILSLALVAALFLAGTARAAPTTTEFPGVAEFSVPVSSTDLLQTSLSSATLDAGTVDGEGTMNLAVLSNGLFITSNPELFTPNTGAVIRFDLNTSVNTAGYNISSIATYAGWNDSGRDRQTFSIEYSTVAAPLAFLPVDTVDFDPANADGGESASRALFSTALTNVKQLRFTFGAQENGHSGYGEFDVIGTPVPEPSTIALGLLGAAGLLAFGRRRR